MKKEQSKVVVTISHTLFPSTDFYCSQLGSHWASSGMSKSSTTTNKVELQDQKVTTSLEEIFCPTHFTRAFHRTFSYRK